MTAEQIAAAHQAEQIAVAEQAAAAGGELWSQVAPAAVAASWLALVPVLAGVVSGAQLAAAGAAFGYLVGLAGEYRVRPRPAGTVVPQSLAGIASDGRPLDTLLYQPAIRTLAAVGAGAPVEQALAVGAVELDMIVRTQVADAGRAADGVEMTAHREMTGYVRMLVPPSCSRCAVLAGRRYAWNAGFQRHPRCDCRHIPAPEDALDDATTDPKAYFDSLSEGEQDRVFTAAGARAIRDGADIAQVVNARRGAAGLTPAGGRLTDEEAAALRGSRRRGRLERTDVFGRQLLVTTEGVTVRGQAGRGLGAREDGVRRPGSRVRSARTPRLMPESIYEIAGDDRAEAIRLLKRFGYLR